MHEHGVSVIFRPLGDSLPLFERGEEEIERAQVPEQKKAPVVGGRAVGLDRMVAGVAEQYFGELLPQSLGGQIKQPGDIVLRRCVGRRVDGKTQLAGKAHHAQDAQAVVPQDEAGVPVGGPQNAVFQIGEPPRGINQLARSCVGIQGVDGEIPARSVLGEAL